METTNNKAAHIDNAELALGRQLKAINAAKRSNAMHQVLVREFCRSIIKVISSKDASELFFASEAAEAYATEIKFIFGEDFTTLAQIAVNINESVRSLEASWS